MPLKIFDLQISTERQHAHLSINGSGTDIQMGFSLPQIPGDPTESQLKTEAKKAARQLLLEAANLL
jgi:hypothetical protein